MPETESDRPRVGGMALANGLLVHDRDHWAAAVRDTNGELRVASGRSPRIQGVPALDLPLVRGVVRLGEAFAVLPLVRRRLPQARFALEDRGAMTVAAAGAIVAALARRRIRSVIAQEAVASVGGLVPALVLLRGSRVAVWHAVEHKCIAAYEEGGVDGVADAARMAKEHTRCGSNLVLPLMVTGTLAAAAVRTVTGSRGMLAKAVATTLSVGLSVEVFAFASRRPEHPVARLVHGAGHWVQANFVTREPAAADLVVGRAALEALSRAGGDAGD